MSDAKDLGVDIVDQTGEIIKHTEDRIGGVIENFEDTLKLWGIGALVVVGFFVMSSNGSKLIDRIPV